MDLCKSTPIACPFNAFFRTFLGPWIPLVKASPPIHREPIDL
jgi:hypothetical protein